MKTFRFFLLLAGLSPALASAQELRIAPVLGLNVATISYSNAYRETMNSPSFNIRTGPLARLQVGGLLDYAFSDRFSFRSGLLITGKGGGLGVTYSQYGITEKARGRFAFSYLEVPVWVSIALGDNGLRLVGGPVVGFTLSARSEVDASPGGYYSTGVTGGSTRFRIGSSATDEVMPLDWGLSLGLAKQFEVGRSPFEVILHVQPSFSKWNTLSKLQPNYYARNLLVGLRAAYFFEVRR